MDTETVVAEALSLLEEGGLANVTIRRLATRLDVKAPSIYWRFADKQALLDAMAEAIIAERIGEPVPPLPEHSWRPWLFERLHTLRAAMLAYPDGARVVAGARPTGTPTLAALTESSLRALEDRGIDLAEAATLVFTAFHYTFGHVIEEQDSTGPTTMDEPAKAAFAEAYPTIARAMAYAQEHRLTGEDLFNAGLELIIGTD
ncbi:MULTISPECIES: TetR/AcrR family transcriptional regulator C-terminal domain-containing protein [Glycomyces]|uniref:TetR/AcrR family tetracycline transcriptional repressor n=2 Tax=Glycomyces TaxID=58113 RepID=A0A9X3PIY1_9ACTN|nr:TetR/AcrR family transcriptional regulator C-terminal domain-containing protein [Glycomyces lechevalierae]MDA1383752.1 TetR/AcrR family transcriptional regulator C-terminal domain-containing protein [Glycomyces lechevalierae]MDR7341257.1 TetR/AcrR family tetracycline transcriptional repressor [Glycomyces lechevalierae]